MIGVPNLFRLQKFLFLPITKIHFHRKQFERICYLSCSYDVFTFQRKSVHEKIQPNRSVAVMKYRKNNTERKKLSERNMKDGKGKEKDELSESTSFGFIDTFFSFHYCNVCK